MRYFTFIELMAMAVEAKQPVEVIVKVGMQLEEKELREQAERRATDEDKAKIFAHMESLAAEGRLSAETSVDDVLAKVGVPRRQGTASVVSFNRKRLLAR